MNNIYTIQRNSNKIKKILENYDKNTTNILFTNCISHINIGDKIINILFDTVLYNLDQETIILIMKNSPLRKDKLIKILEEKNINYHEVKFNTKTNRHYHFNDSKDLCFTNKDIIIKKAIENSQEKNINNCIYFPNVKGNLKIGYYNEKGKEENIIDINLESLIDLNDKLILLTNNKNNSIKKETAKALYETDINVTINNNKKLNNSFKDKVKIKIK